MIPIFLYNQDIQVLKKLHNIISNYIMIEELDMALCKMSTNKIDIVEYFEDDKLVLNGIYFISLTNEGIELAKFIRQYDTLGKIIFILDQPQDLHFVVTSQCEPLDCIMQSDLLLQQKVICCLKISEEKLNKTYCYHKNNYLSIKVGYHIKNILFDDIMFFESSPIPHKVIAHLNGSTLDFYYLMRDLVQEDRGFYRCHRSFIVNVNNIVSINKREKSILMKNNSICYYSSKYKRELLQKMM